MIKALRAVIHKNATPQEAEEMYNSEKSKKK
jgi:hypothetical protein